MGIWGFILGTGTCVYPSSATGTGTAMPLTTNPPVTGTPFSTIPTPTTSSSTGTTGSPYSIPASGYDTLNYF